MEAFELMPEGTHCQLINDVIVMSPAPTTPHFLTQSKIFSALNNFVEHQQLGTVFFAPVDVYLNKKNAFQPDIFYVPAEKNDIIKERGIEGVPDLIIEVLSKGNEKYDLNEKKGVYESAGVKEYWVVDPKTKWREGFILENGVYKSLGEGSGELRIQMFDLPISF
ncbi:MAG: Uma2 family endonuclease [Bacteroidota bacterium]|nr:Uma2 family endonuclease [Bacteroidota bacterium]